jgi:hypothetical protein
MFPKKRFAILTGLLLFGFSFSALGNTVPSDPVGFCPVGGDCFDGNGTGAGAGQVGETIGINGTKFQMEKNGNTAASSSPWDLLVAIPNDVGGLAPTLTISGGFAVSAGFPKDVGTFLPTTTGSIYAFAGLFDTTPKSMLAANMFGTDEQGAFGGTPTSFEIFDYRYSPGFIGAFTPYTITVGGAGLPNGTFLATDGGSSNFTTPFTMTGLVGGTVPEPSEFGFVAGAFGLLGLMHWRTRKQQA